MIGIIRSLFPLPTTLTCSAVAKWIVDRHKGYFQVISREGVGTRMVVCLPSKVVDRDASGETAFTAKDAESPPVKQTAT